MCIQYPEDIASLFKDYFASVFESDDAVIDSTYEPNAPVLSEIILTVEEDQAVLETLDATKSTEPDDIPARLLKETAPVISVSLCTLFKKSLRQDVLPENCKIANIIPVYKKSEKEHAKNYQPISLLSIVSKALERCVLNDIRAQLYQVITASQHGLTRGRSCMTNLLEVINHISSVLNVGGQVVAVYLDMSKAFDKVNHNTLFQKLRMAGFGRNLSHWFQSYLTGRQQRVTVQGCTSTTLPVT